MPPWPTAEADPVAALGRVVIGVTETDAKSKTATFATGTAFMWVAVAADGTLLDFGSDVK